jgi:ClpP class serine protease
MAGNSPPRSTIRHWSIFTSNARHVNPSRGIRMHQVHQLIPTVVENNGPWERAFDIYSLLLKNRIVFLNTPINQQVANLVIAQLLYLNGEASQQPVHLYISSPGGDVYAGLAMYDTMQMIIPPVYTYAVGVTASMGTALLAAGAPGHRYALPHAQFTCTRRAAAPKAIQRMSASPFGNKNGCRPNSFTYWGNIQGIHGRRLRIISSATAL